MGGVNHLHLMFQTTGGDIGDGIALYNLFRALPITISLYNVGGYPLSESLHFLALIIASVANTQPS
jgi:ATP-dependent protease ClpP protease subunit